MTLAIITFDIIEYLPSEFKFDNCSFIISSENRDFEQEISYLNKNQITHRVNLTKRDLKYSIKVTRNSSLIGISDIIIPSQILSKKANIFDQTCSITMSDSVRRVLFGNTSTSNYLKVNIHMTLQYKEIKEKHINKTNDKKDKEKDKSKDKNKDKDKDKSKEPPSKLRSTSGKKFKSKERSESIGKIGEKKKDVTDTFSQRIVGASTKNKNIKKHRSNSKPVTTKIDSQTMKPKTQIFNNNNNKLKEVQNEILDEELDEIKKLNKNESFIDEKLNKYKKETNPQLINFMKEFNKKNPLNKLNNYSDVNEMMEYSKNVFEQLLEFQLKYCEIFNKTISVKNKFKNLMIQYNEKLRNMKKQINKLDEDNDIYELKGQLIDKNNYNDLKDFYHLKGKELDILKEYGAYVDKSSGNNEEDKENQKLDEKENNKEKAQNLLIKVLTHSVNKYGPVNKLFTQTNSTESERTNIRKLANKYNLPLNSGNEDEHNNNNQNDNSNDKKVEEDKEEKTIENADNNEKMQKNTNDSKITKWEYVLTEKPDKIDKKLEQYLKYFYSKRTLPKVLFKKTLANNYEYGTQKVMVKIEGDTIRIRYVGGYLLIDKFIELNAAAEDKKMKKQNEKANSNANKKKDKKK